jgi:SMI1 / KNR4 family (SUKH-1)
VGTMTNADMLTASLRKVVELHGPATEGELLAAERRLGLELLSGVREFYLRANGTLDSTSPEHGWTRIWPVSEWSTVTETTGSPIYDNIASLPILADHCAESWWYAMELRPGNSDAGAIYIVDGLRPGRIVGFSFEEFVAKVIQNDADIYPKDQSAG